MITYCCECRDVSCRCMDCFALTEVNNRWYCDDYENYCINVIYCDNFEKGTACEHGKR